MIIDERMVTYINSLDTGHTPFLENLERTAKQTKVPIIRREMQSFLKVFLKMKQPKRILEVGTAVGFSAVFMAQYGEPDADNHNRKLRKTHPDRTGELRKIRLRRPHHADPGRRCRSLKNPGRPVRFYLYGRR